VRCLAAMAQASPVQARGCKRGPFHPQPGTPLFPGAPRGTRSWLTAQEPPDFELIRKPVVPPVRFDLFLLGASREG
jgi:hypothetical protein